MIQAIQRIREKTQSMKNGKKWCLCLKVIHKVQAIFRKWHIHRAMDAYIIEHPKCGRTWVRFILHDYMNNTGNSLKIGYTHDGTEFNILDSKRLEKWKYFSRRKYRKKKIIFLLRDPRDVMVSLYFQATRRSCVLPKDYPISDFIRGSSFGIDKMITFLNIWQRVFKKHIVPNYLLIRYEDLHSNCYSQMEKIITFLGTPLVKDCLERAVIENLFENLRSKERNATIAENDNSYGILKAKDVNDPESFKVRRGVIGGYVDYLSPEDVRYINEKLQNNLISEIDEFWYP